jgi:hypothetical protein
MRALSGVKAIIPLVTPRQIVAKATWGTNSIFSDVIRVPILTFLCVLCGKRF